MSVTLDVDWYNQNFIILENYGMVIMDVDSFLNWVLIGQFLLPCNYDQSTTNVLLLLPGLDKPACHCPIGIYADKHITINGRTPNHYYNDAAYHGFPDLSEQGFAFVCVIINEWNPCPYDVMAGDNLFTIMNTLYHELKKL